jgi:hypothetical protein
MSRWVAWLLPLLVAAIAVAATSSAAGRMRSTKLSPHLCKTVRGGRFVPIPGFPGERIDRRLLPDIRWMKTHFHIFITDGYSMDPVHAENGEHPLGLATDIVPNRAKGGTWNDVAALAHLAEPKQNYPIPPWRWVGWNGDEGHGRGDHLHLSWMHSPAEPGHPARVVYTRRCPDAPAQAPTRRTTRHRQGPTGGTSPSGGGGFSGGVSAGKLSALAPAVPDE